MIILNHKYFQILLIFAVTGCLFAGDECILSIGHSAGLSGSAGHRIVLSLKNPVLVAGLQWTLADDAKALHIDSVVTTERTKGFAARTHNNQVVLFDLHGRFILQGSGPVAEMIVHVDTVSRDTIVMLRIDPAPVLANLDGNRIKSLQVSNGSFTIYTGTSVQSKKEDDIDDYRLFNNHPNPFNAITAIQFQLKQSALVTLDVFAVDGALVAKLVHAKLPQGRHRVVFNAAALASGLYFYRMTVADFVSVQKMIVVK